jgi:hypothetical protein
VSVFEFPLFLFLGAQYARQVTLSGTEGLNLLFCNPSHTLARPFIFSLQLFSRGDLGLTWNTRLAKAAAVTIKTEMGFHIVSGSRKKIIPALHFVVSPSVMASAEHR